MIKFDKSRGSILIWTLLLGISLAVIFFFFSQRLGSNLASQRETIEYQNARLYFESYTTYLQGLGTADLKLLRGGLEFDGISGNLTNETDSIVGMLDMGAEVTYEVEGGDARIEWNLCTKDEEGIMEISPVTEFFDNGCINNYKTYTLNSGPSFTLKSQGEPFTYRISQQVDEAVIYDNEWQLELEYPLGFRKKLKTSIVFTPGS